MPTSKRASYLQHTEQQLMIDWMRTLTKAFNQQVPYLVGSVLERRDFRDVDVRVILDDAEVDAFPVDLRYLNLAISLWGQQVTGLPIDFQVQRQSDANKPHNDKARHALGIGQ